MRAYERFIKYVTVHTASSEESTTTPSTQIQFDLANLLRDEMLEMGISDARVDEHCYVYGSIPATPGYENTPCIGFIAHLDTIPDFSGENVKPTLVENYDGGDVVLGTSGRTLSPREFPHLKKYVGKTLIVTDGTTVLGADDKAGVAEIMQLAEYLLAHPEFPYGTVKIGFTPDEEIGRGADLFDVTGFAADFGYTLDGDAAGGIEYENFNAAGAKVTVHGRNIHPGSAKNKMLHACKVAMEFHSMLPVREAPENTEGYEGFFHLTQMSGNEEQAYLQYIIRDHDREKFAVKKERIMKITDYLNDKYGAGTVVTDMRDQYENMKEIIDRNPDIIERAREAVRSVGLTPFSHPVRGGTDGARLCYMGLPCPNLGTGGGNYHGNFEYASVDEMYKTVEILKALVKAR
ncbi:MAG: peptidase T [Oscillospiraceae bacterium]|nr:peptidase T [Oscillospiraceae bacterium]